MKLFYGTTTDRRPIGATYRNPRFFQGIDPAASVVYLDGPYPAIASAYLAADVLVVELGAGATGKTAPALLALPADWRDFDFGKAGTNPYSLKALAEFIAGKSVKSKAEAVKILEAYEAEHLDEPLDEAGGLTRRELNADLTERGLDVEPGEDPAAALDRIRAADAAQIEKPVKDPDDE